MKSTCTQESVRPPVPSTTAASPPPPPASSGSATGFSTSAMRSRAGELQLRLGCPLYLLRRAASLPSVGCLSAPASAYSCSLRSQPAAAAPGGSPASDRARAAACTGKLAAVPVLDRAAAARVPWQRTSSSFGRRHSRCQPAPASATAPAVPPWRPWLSARLARVDRQSRPAHSERETLLIAGRRVAPAATHLARRRLGAAYCAAAYRRAHHARSARAARLGRLAEGSPPPRPVCCAS